MISIYKDIILKKYNGDFNSKRKGVFRENGKK